MFAIIKLHIHTHNVWLVVGNKVTHAGLGPCCCCLAGGVGVVAQVGSGVGKGWGGVGWGLG